MFNIKKQFKGLGPGVVTGAADDDPSGIATYSQTGAKFGYGLLWMAVVTWPLMYAVEEMSARLAMTTGRGLADIMKRHFSRKLVAGLCLLFFVVNLVNIGANLGAMAEAMTLILPGHTTWYLLFFGALIAALEVFVSYRRYTKILRWSIIALFAYVITAFLTKQDWSQVVFDTIVPSFQPHPDFWLMIVAVLGTTIAPYMFFWQAAEEVEEEIADGRNELKERRGVTEPLLKRMRIDVMTGMLLSNLVMFFIIVTTAGTLHQAGIDHIDTAAQAAEALRPLAGNLAFLLFAIGIVGTGMIGVPVLAGSAAFAMAEVFGWREGLEQKFSRARPFNLTIIVIIGLGMLFSIFGISPIRMLIIAAVLNGLLAPILLWFIVRLANNRAVVGKHVSPPHIRWLGWITWAVMTVAGLMLISQWVF